MTTLPPTGPHAPFPRDGQSGGPPEGPSHEGSAPSSAPSSGARRSLPSPDWTPGAPINTDGRYSHDTTAVRGSRPLIPGYEVGPVLGRGGFAVVHRGHQVALDREVAIKVDSRVLDDERNRRRFLREATAVARIDSHPHVVSLVDVGTTDDNRPYLVMEFCPGGSISDALKAQSTFPSADACELGLAISSALAAAHAAGIVHRDVKPANILIDAYGTPRLSDFGLAMMTQADTETSVTLEAMTPAYSAPEVLAQEVPTPRSDVWSMGATLYAMISGQPPRKRADGSAASLGEILNAVGEPFPDPGTPGSTPLMQVIWRATHVDPAQRYADGTELHRALVEVRPELGPARRVVGGPQAMLPEAQSLNPSPAPAAPRRWTGLVAGLLIGALVGGAAGIGGTLLLDRRSDAATHTTNPPTTAPTSGAPNSGAPTEASSPPSASASVETPPPTGGCWGGITSISGDVTARQIECSEPHVWETYASGLLDEKTPSANTDDVATDPVVLKTCTEAAVRSYVTSKRKMTVRTQVIPPSAAQFVGGKRGFACVISEEGKGAVTGSINDS